MSSSAGSYAGTLSIHGGHYLATIKVSGTLASGSYDVSGQTHRFTLTREGDGLMLTSDGASYRLTRRVSTAPAPEAAQTAPELVGSWRNSTSSAEFNADGTGVVNGTPGRYEIRGNRLTLIGAQAENTMRFEVHGDVLALNVNGKPVTLNRVKEEAGEGGVRVGIVGKWCWISLSEAKQGARKFSRCLTLNGSGTYAFADETDSRNPNGGGKPLAADSGTWTAVETSLTTHSLTGKATTYQLEKRNHPGKVRDPMIVLDGQAYVSFYRKTPW